MDHSLVISLVHAYLLAHPEYYSSFVNAYVQLRWDPKLRRAVHTRVGGHYRRLAQWGNVCSILRQVCKFEPIGKPTLLNPPERPIRRRRDEEGELIARRHRMLVFA